VTLSDRRHAACFTSGQWSCKFQAAIAPGAVGHSFVKST